MKDTEKTEEEIKDILDVLWTLRKGDKFHFYSYGKDLIKHVIDSNKTINT